MEKAMQIVRKATAIFFVLSLFFFVRSSFELFYLTCMYGPQMIFFSLVHSWPEWAVNAILVSWFAYYAFLFFAVIVAVQSLFQSKEASTKLVRYSRYALIIYSAHFILLSTYDFWSPWLGP